MKFILPFPTVFQHGDVIISLGTSDTFMMWLDNPTPKTEGHVFVNPVDNDAYMAMLWYGVCDGRFPLKCISFWT